jgi:hypothetical protein
MGGLSRCLAGNLKNFQNWESKGFLPVAVAPGSGFRVQRFKGSGFQIFLLFCFIIVLVLVLVVVLGFLSNRIPAPHASPEKNEDEYEDEDEDDKG